MPVPAPGPAHLNFVTMDIVQEFKDTFCC